MSREDRWLLPRRQTEYPTYGLLSEATVHGRREATFLALAAILLVTLTPLLWLGSTRIIDLGALFVSSMPGASLPVPIGVMPFALGVVSVLLVCELFGRRRALALIAVSAIAAAALIGLSALARDDAPPMLPALAFATSIVVAELASLVIFDSLRQRFAGRQLWLRTVVTALVAQPLGWAAFAAVLIAAAHGAPVESTQIAELAIGSAVFTTACLVAGALPLAIAARMLRLYLRVARHETIVTAARDPNATEPVKRLSPALIVDVDPGPDVPEPPRRRQRSVRNPAHAFSSAELRFFSDGDEL